MVHTKAYMTRYGTISVPTVTMQQHRTQISALTLRVFTSTLKRKSIPRSKVHFWGFMSTQTSHVKTHIKLVHEKTKDKKCPLCDYVASLNQALETHIKAIHNKVKLHKCPLISLRGYSLSTPARITNANTHQKCPLKRKAKYVSHVWIYIYQPCSA